MPILPVFDQAQIEQLRNKARSMSVGMGQAGLQYYLQQIAREHGFTCWHELVQHEKEHDAVGSTSDIVAKVLTGKLVNSIFASSPMSY